ncbi:hypothetical protein [Chitinophaga japonensis]|uniref:Lipoprotein n=1 Tax=Chitinophaga japonensis TaxID=104662 RepID=A0A562SZV8_CHIJA|nr:hypothetical protein [Chitinophaga japonensis]TWI86366.1 hypothetical protein LX66_3623 [Chitinophaga japonensis]
MKTRQLADSLTRKFYYLPLILLGAVSFGTGCQKSKPSNPCEGIVSEGTPTLVGLVLVDGQTGENILLSRNIDTSTITIIPEATDIPAERGAIVKEPGAPMYGSLVFRVADTKEGAFKYTINIPDVASATLSYTNKKEKSGNECNPYYIVVTDPVIEDHEFTVSRTGHRLLFNVTL